MATRREALAAVIGDELDSLPGLSVAEPAGAEAGFPFELLQRSGSVDDSIPTKVKSDKEAPKTEKKTAERKPRGTAAERQLSEIGESLEEKVIQFSLLAQGLAPVTSVYAAENSPKAVAALLSIAKRRPKVLSFLEKAADGVDALELAKFIGGIVVCIQVDAQRLRGDELPAQALGVTQILQEHFWTEDSQVENPAMEYQQAPRYVAV